MRSALQIDERGEITGTILANGPSIVIDEKVIEIPWKVYEDWIMAYGQDKFYYDRMQVLLKRREEQPVVVSKLNLTADGVDNVIFTNILSNSFITIKSNEVMYDINKAPLQENDTFSTTIPGTYNITIDCWPYLPTKVTLTTILP